MAGRTDHVIVRNGSPSLAEPRPTPAPRPAEDHTAETGIAEFGGAYADKSYVGQRDERANFAKATGTPSPRQLAQRKRGGNPADQSTTPKDLPAAPLG
jgi:hypothetical protein